MSESIIGLQRGIVKLSPYCSEWPALYEAEEKLLRKSLGNLVLDIQHVGSTSIPGLISKPIIDIAIAVKTISDCDNCIKPLVKIGYHFRHGAGPKDGYHFAKGPESNRTHYIHIGELNGKMWYDHILFRDYLKSHFDIMEKYAELKTKLASKYAYDRASYTAGKDEFISKIIKKAKVEYGIQN